MSQVGPEAAFAEFAALRAEIDTRVKYQQQILALQLTLTSAIFAFALSRPAFLGVLLIVPLSSYLLCARYVAQRSSVRRISTYIDSELSPRVEGGLGWTKWARVNRRSGRLIDWFLPLILCFPGASGLALAWTLRPVVLRGMDPLRISGDLRGVNVGLGAIWLVGTLISFASIYLLVRVLFKK